MFPANKTKIANRWNQDTPVGLFLSLDPCWSGAGSKKDPGAAGKTYDIVLESIPWTISIVKLPWMDKRIDIEWKKNF
jgi:hypothetical protein